MFKKTVIISEHELGLHWNRGQLIEVLKDGEYKIGRNEEKENIEVLDTRIVSINMSGQEVVLVDQVQVKFNLIAEYRIYQPQKFIKNYDSNMIGQKVYSDIQIALRNQVAKYDHQQIIAKHKLISKEIAKEVKATLETIGLKLESLEIKDIIWPHEIRNAYTAELNARLQSKAKLEQARGQTAALRHIANTGSIVKQNPDLLQLMALQKEGAILNISFENTKSKSSKIKQR